MDGLEYIPMFWGNKSISQFGGVQPLVSGGSIQAVLGMNECVHVYDPCTIHELLNLLMLPLHRWHLRPTTPGQSELTPGQAAELWIRYLEPLKQVNSSLRLGSPALANGEAGIPWLQQFLGNCTGCSVDFIALR